MIRHTALIKLVSEAEDVVAVVAQGLQSLIADSPDVADAEVSRDLALRPRSPRTAQLMLTLDFESVECFEAYVTSTAHERFVYVHSSYIAAMLGCQVEYTTDDLAGDRE